MTRFTLLFIVCAALTSPAIAGSYSATPATAPVAERIVGNDLVWACTGGVCKGSTEYGRSLVICQNLARKAGRLDNFVVDGQAIAAAELEKCNTAAKSGGSAAIANAN